MVGLVPAEWFAVGDGPAAYVEYLSRRLADGGAEVDVPELAAHLEGLVRVAEGADGAGPIAALDQSERFGWLAAPSSTIVQASEVHTGLCEDPVATLEGLFARLVTAP